MVGPGKQGNELESEGKVSAIEQLRNDLRAARAALDTVTTDQGRIEAEMAVLELVELLAEAVIKQAA